MQKPSLGRIVHAYIHPMLNGGSDIAAAAIVAVNEDSTVNLRILVDGSSNPPWVTGVHVYDNEQDARHAQRTSGGDFAFWPPKV